MSFRSPLFSPLLDVFSSGVGPVVSPSVSGGFCGGSAIPPLSGTWGVGGIAASSFVAALCVFSTEAALDDGGVLVFFMARER